MHWSGRLSGRQRTKRVPWRKRSPVTWSYWTSATSLGFSGSHCALRSVDQRLGPPGASPVNPGPPFKASTLRVSAGRSLVGDARGEADVIELAVVVEQAEQQRADLLAVRGVAEAADDAVGGAQAFHLHHRALAGAIGLVEALGDDAVQLAAAGALQPAFGLGALSVAGDRRSDGASPSVAKKASSAARRSLSGRAGEIGAARRLQQVEHDQDRRRLGGELVHAARGGMQAQLQGVEGEDLADRNRELAVEDEAFGLQRAQAPRPCRESSAPGSCPSGSASRPCRRRGSRGSESRPIWARTASPRRAAARIPDGLPSRGSGCVGISRGRGDCCRTSGP